MKKILPLFLALLLFFEVTLSSYAELGSFSGSHSATVSGTVGEFYLSLFGYITPYASIVLSTDGILMRAAVADKYGNFSIPLVLIKRGFSHFCLDAIDFRRTGESYTCFNIDPATGSVVMRDIFLPPTLGLSRNQIAEGGTTLAFGYTMPGALVTLYLSSGKKLTTYADPSGYYEFTLSNLKAGQYSLYAKAEYKNKESLAPTKKLQLHALSWWEQLIAFLQELWKKIILFLTSLSLGPLWFVIPIIILIIILIFKLWPGRFRFITIPLSKTKKPLHHSWWMGY